jgi:hypothetical protein
MERPFFARRYEPPAGAAEDGSTGHMNSSGFASPQNKNSISGSALATIDAAQICKLPEELAAS